MYGLSEHMPRYRPQDLYPEEQDMSVADLETTFAAYIEEATKLKEANKGDITLLVGLETDVIHANSITQLESVLSRYQDKLDYVVGSLHHVLETPIDFDKPTFEQALQLSDDSLERFFASYYETLLRLLKAIQPEVVGHFDLCRLYIPQVSFSDYPVVWKQIESVIDYIVSYDGLVEINAAAFRKGWSTSYPGSDIFDLMISKGVKFCLSDDSHGPHAVGLHYSDACTFLRSKNMTTLWYLDLPKEGEEPLHRGRGRTVIRKVEGTWWTHPVFSVAKS